MKLLFDQNLSPRLPVTLADIFPDSVHVREVDLRDADDSIIWEYAKQHEFAIVSKDADFQQRSLLYGSPPKDDCRIEVSFNRLPPHDYTGFPIAKALQDVYKDDFRRLTPTIDSINVVRHDLRAAWAEYSFVDPVEIRDAFTCALIGIGNNVRCLITCDFWASDAARIRPAWNELVRTLQLGVHIADPTTGKAQMPHLN